LSKANCTLPHSNNTSHNNSHLHSLSSLVHTPLKTAPTWRTLHTHSNLLLTKTSRLHSFPSAFFYGGALRNGITSQHRAAPFHPPFGSSSVRSGTLSQSSPRDQSSLTHQSSLTCLPASLAMGPLVVWDVAEGREGRGKGGSFTNSCEAQAAAALYKGKGGGGGEGRQQYFVCECVLEFGFWLHKPHCAALFKECGNVWFCCVTILYPAVKISSKGTCVIILIFGYPGVSIVLHVAVFWGGGAGHTRTCI